MKHVLAFALCCSIAIGTMPFVACNSSAALADVKKFEPVVINALVLACAFSPAAPVCGTGQATITADYNLVIKVWTDYNAAVAAGTSTAAMWNDLNAAFTTFEQDSASIFTLASGLNQPEITAIVAAAQVLLGAIEALFPAAPVGATRPKSAVFASVSRGRASYDKTWLKGWIADYNVKVGTAQKAHPTVKIKKVHYHDFALRMATFGMAK